LSQDANSQDQQQQTKDTGKSKHLYKGIFCLASETYIRRTQAFSEAQAKAQMIRKIAKDKGLVNGGGLYRVFDGHLNNFVIEKER